MPIRFDRTILQSHADALYEKADAIVWNSAVASAISVAVGGAAVGFVMAYGLALDVSGCVVLGSLVGGVIGYAWGWQLGQEQAFRLRLQAQELLCQMMIERNTAGLLRLASGQSGSPARQLDDATLDALRPGRSMQTRMGRLGQ